MVYKRLTRLCPVPDMARNLLRGESYRVPDKKHGKKTSIFVRSCKTLIMEAQWCTISPECCRGLAFNSTGCFPPKFSSFPCTPPTGGDSVSFICSKLVCIRAVESILLSDLFVLGISFMPSVTSRDSEFGSSSSTLSSRLRSSSRMLDLCIASLSLVPLKELFKLWLIRSFWERPEHPDSEALLSTSGMVCKRNIVKWNFPISPFITDRNNGCIHVL